MNPRRAASERGFSMAELMAVVTIVAILATLAIQGLRRYVNSSRTSEAAAVIQAIRAAQEAYRAEYHQYLDVSGNLTTYYPSAPDAQMRPFFANPAPGGALDIAWRTLSPAVKRHVRFGYASVAGLPGAAIPALSTADTPNWGTPTEPWYLIQAASDFDGGGNRGYVAASSFSPELYMEEE